MEWRDEGVLLAVRAHGESAAIIEVFTFGHGCHAGVVRGGASRRLAPLLQPGAQLDLSWRARLEAHLGAFTVEPIRSRAWVLGDRRQLAGLAAVCALVRAALPEREPNPVLWRATVALLDALEVEPDWPLRYLRWELGLLEELGFGLDLARCAVTGSRDDLAYVSPRTGRAVSRQGAGEWADRLLALPAGISDTVIAGALLKGLTAQYLVTASHVVQPGETVLVHAAAGGVGLLLGQWLKALGATAIGTAGTDAKVALARAHGYAHVINYRSADFAAEVRRLTEGRGVAAVYDSVGQDTWAGSLKCLARRGMFVSFGQSSGMIQGFTLTDLARAGSLSATRPVLFDFIASRAELLARSDDLFARLGNGSLKVPEPHTWPLRDAGAAHTALEARQTTGATILLP
ncbi:MAG: DNA repair protein RecO [Rhodobacteraceae bacterium CG2_30_10_405]|nr:MAG: DNA repair protein RecO [Rhodobacteraceae bacterium CG2_30_10_405]